MVKPKKHKSLNGVGNILKFKVKGGKFKNLIVGIFGELGTGKTMLLTLIGYYYFLKGWKIYSNYRVTFPHTLVKSLDDIKDLDLSKDSIFIFDELWITADARRHSTDENITISQSILQSRKKRMSIFYTAQYPRLVEQRIRMITNYVLKPTIVGFNPDSSPALMVVEKFARNSLGYVKPLGRTIPNVNLAEVGKLYDTEEVITPTNVKTRYENLAAKYIKKFKKTKQLPKKKDLIAELVMEHKTPMNRAIVISDFILKKIVNPTGK